MYDYALKVLKNAKESLEEEFNKRKHESLETAAIEYSYICDVADAIDTLESIAEGCDSEESDDAN